MEADQTNVNERALASNAPADNVVYLDEVRRAATGAAAQRRRKSRAAPPIPAGLPEAIYVHVEADAAGDLPALALLVAKLMPANVPVVREAA